MEREDNGVNIDARRGYHHGGLRAALIAHGMRLIEQRVAEEISLREIARAAGVSATAVYRHFPDKVALLRALSAAGFQRLGGAQAAAMASAGPGAAGLKASGMAYLRFARTHPGLFRLMFGHAPQGAGEAEDADAQRSMHLLQACAAETAAPGAGPEGARLLALQAWSLVHGLAHLILDGQLEADEALIGRILDSALAPFR